MIYMVDHRARDTGAGTRIPERVDPDGGWGESRVIPRNEKRSTIVARQIVNEIASRQLAPGAALPSEQALVRQLGAGRGSVREALRLLEANGLIVMKPGLGGGPVLSAPTGADFGHMSTLYYQVAGYDFRDVLEARAALDGTLAGAAADSHTDEDATELRAILHASRASGTQNDARYIDLADDFHNAVYTAAHLPILALHVRAMNAIVLHRITEVSLPPSHRGNIIHEHDEIADAIFQRDRPRAALLMRQHHDDYISYLEESVPSFLEAPINWRSM